MVKLARKAGAKAEEQTARLAGVVTRDGRSAGGGRVGVWQKRPKEFNRVNAAIQRGRVVPIDAYESHRTTVRPDGSFAVEGFRTLANRGPCYLVHEEPGRPPTVVGPLTIRAEDRAITVNLVLGDGGAIEGRVANVPEAMAGQIWVVAFDDGVVRRETLAKADGSFRLENLPPGRYGLKAGHDAYEDPHVPRGDLSKLGPDAWKKLAEPWQGAVPVMVGPGETARGIVVDLRPPGPLVDAAPRP